MTLVIVVVGEVVGCEWSPFRRGGDPHSYWLPLRVVVKFDPSVTTAALAYEDACHQQKILSVGGDLTYLFRREIGLAFERVYLDVPLEESRAHGELEISLGLKEIELSIPRRADKTYPARVHLGGTVVFRDANGEVLYTKSLRVDRHGEVKTSSVDCEVFGLSEVIMNAGLTLAQGFKRYLGTSVKLMEYAQRARTMRRSPMRDHWN